MAKPRQSSSLSRGFENQDPLTALSPLDGRYFSETKELREYGSELAVMSF